MCINLYKKKKHKKKKERKENENKNKLTNTEILTSLEEKKISVKNGKSE